MAVTASPPDTASIPPWRDFAHTGPGTLAGRYLRRFWQPVYLARELPAGQAKPIHIMSEDYTLYRGAGGTPHLVDFRCAHRGTQLSTGWVEDDCIRCFYHGWKYDGTGQCVEMPAEDPSFPPKVKLKSYPTEEYLGLIFAYLGEGEPPPLPRYPQLEAEGLLETSIYDRPCNYFNSVENVVDEVHVAFTHRASGFTDHGLNHDLPRVWGEETDYGVAQYGERSSGEVRIGHVLMPNQLYILINPEAAGTPWIDWLAWRVPVDDEHHRSFNVALIHLSGEAVEQYRARQAERQALLAGLPSVQEVSEAILRGELHADDVADRPDVVAIQDWITQVGQGAIADRTNERLGQSDRAVILLRQVWERELRALAEGQPLKAWTRPERIAVTTGV